MLIIILSIIFLIVLWTNNEKETFQSLKTKHGYRQVDWIPPIRERHEILTLPTLDYYSCQHLCTTTPNCDGVNYFLNECTLYKHLRNPLVHDKKFIC
jgi:hypothetical protein